MPKAIIAPSVLASDLSNLANECKRMMGDGADWLHMGMSGSIRSGYLSPTDRHFPPTEHELTTDVMDGHFVPNITMGPPILSCVRDNVPNIFMDCHMMVSDPAKVRRGGAAAQARLALDYRRLMAVGARRRKGRRQAVHFPLRGDRCVCCDSRIRTSGSCSSETSAPHSALAISLHTGPQSVSSHQTRRWRSST